MQTKKFPEIPMRDILLTPKMLPSLMTLYWGSATAQPKFSPCSRRTSGPGFKTLTCLSPFLVSPVRPATLCCVSCKTTISADVRGVSGGVHSLAVRPW
jgi:hypothetical protein